MWPGGACREADGTVIVFSVGAPLASCEALASDAALAVRPACGDAHEGTHAARCEGAAESGPLTFSRRPMRPPFREQSLDPAPGRCEVLPEGETDGEWHPWHDADELCTDLAPSCATPIVLDLVEGGDPCGGAERVERCHAELVGGRIVLRAEWAPALGPCPAEIGERVARCALPPLAIGRYEVVDDRGRALGAIEVGVEGRGGRTCSAIPPS